jgi:exopolyphosphatase/guanosine-5'-triphosphate,3'-diphosphate pyrophosphatase
MTKTRIAAIDIGTNSIRCIVAEVISEGKFRVIDDEKATVRLGENLTESGVISPEAAERATAALRHFRKLLTGFKVAIVEAVATSAVRIAANGPEVVAAMSSGLGHEIRVIDGVEEAGLAAVSALSNFDMSGKRYAMIDIGGGSLEVVSAFGNHVEECYSLDLGAVVMTERFLESDPVKSGELQRLQRHIRGRLKQELPGQKLSADLLIGSGGTITSIGYMAMNLRRDSYVSVHGYEVLRSEVIHLLAMLTRKDLKARGTVPGLSPDRADIIIAGVALVDELMRFFGANRLMVNERGIREGLIIGAMKRNGLMPQVTPSRTWRAAVLEFARSCNVEEPHALHVSHLALSIYDALALPFGLKKSERRILEAAAILHDSGCFINYGGHHKHTYHLVRHAELFGFSPRERELIAMVARYHRKSAPKRKHGAFQALREKDRILVSRLGGILRLADGLDRRRCALVQEVACEFGGNVISLRLTGSEDMSVEIFGGSAKKDLFEKAFGTVVVFEA